MAAKETNGSAVSSKLTGTAQYYTGGNGADVINATGFTSVLNATYAISGGNGNDTIVGSSFNDLIKGDGDSDNGADNLKGGAGADTIFGGNGADLIQGDAGADVLQGDRGGDRFVYVDVGDSLNQDGKFDTITDFTSGSDKLDLGGVPLTGAAFGTELLWKGTTNTGDTGMAYSVWYSNGFVYADTNGDTTADLKIKVNVPTLAYGDFIGINAAPTAVADSFTVAEGASLAGASVATGDSDPDGDTLNYSLKSASAAGVAIDLTSGAVSFTASKATYGRLALGDTATVTGVYTASDGHGGTADAGFTITVTGVNDAPTTAATPLKADVTEGDASAPGTITGASDIDDGETATLKYAAAVDAPSNFHLNDDGTWTFDASVGAYDHLAAGATQDVELGYTVTDVHNASGDGVLTITVHGVNDAATISGATTGAVTEDTAPTVSGDLTVSDVDDLENKATVLTNAAGTYGKFSVTADGHWTYTLDDSAVTNALTGTDEKTETFTVDSKDGTAHQDVTITVHGTNDPASISGDTAREVTEDSPTTTVGGDLTVTDADSGENKVVAQPETSGTYGKFSITAAGHWTYVLDNSLADPLNTGDNPIDTFTVYSLDGTDSEVVTITVHGHTDYTYVTPPVVAGTGDPNDFDASGNSAGQNLSNAGTNSADTIYGGAGDDVINGGGGDDLIYAGSGADTVKGNADNDRLFGGSGNDVIQGNEANDRIIGGFGADTLTGGQGNDTFVYLSKNDTGDTITDFSHSEGDKLDFTAVGATHFAGALSGAGLVGAHEVGYVVVGTVTHVYVDTDGVYGADLEINLTGSPTLVTGDFVGLT